MEDLLKKYNEFARDEITENIIYARLAAKEKNSENREILLKMSAQEKSHYDFWLALSNQKSIKPKRSAIRIFSILSRIMGLTFTTKFLESNEKDAIAEYGKILEILPEGRRARLREIIEDEKSHELVLLRKIEDKKIAYLSFIVLGLSDAIVEITGVHAGFLGITGSTLIAGVSGLIVGFSAAISMGSAAYLQAKQDIKGSPILSALATGVSYLLSVVLLALPYLLLRGMAEAFIISSLVGILLISSFTFYGSVVFERKFWHDFIEAVFLMLGTATASFFVGRLINNVFHINGHNF